MFGVLLLPSVFSAYVSVVKPISTGGVPGVFPELKHPKAPANVAASVLNRPVQTNKFYGNLLVEDPVNPVFQLPYVIKGLEKGPYLAISHCDARTTVAASGTEDRVQYYFAAFNENIRVGATELGANAPLQVTSDDPFSTSFTLGGRIEVPVVRGGAYVTAIFRDSTPKVGTIHALTGVNGDAPGTHTGSKFKLTLNNGQFWIVYVIDATSGNDVSVTLRYDDGWLIGTERVNNVAFRVAKLPHIEFDGTTEVPAGDVAAAEAIFDAHYATYDVGAEFFGEVDQDAKQGRYGFVWQKKGKNGPLLKFALAHHLEQFAAGVDKVNVHLLAPTVGMMTGVVGDRWELNEPDIATIGQVGHFALRDIPEGRKADIRAALSKDIDGLSSINIDSGSYYYAGKAFHRAAELALVADALGDAAARQTALDFCKKQVRPFLDGSTENNLVHDITWGGVSGRKGLDDYGFDFGNGYYNDHHFHWGYFFTAFAIIGKYDPGFINEARDWIQTLIRDVMNPSSDDKLFPVFRSFDWFCGSCFSQGIFASADGKDEESSSEEINMHYGLMLWGLTSGNADIHRLGQLSLAVSARTIRRYFLMSNNNDIHPKNFIGNKVTGIKFENKVDYATWFGGNMEYKHGIQMIPALPCTEYVRTRTFCREEWDLIGGIVDRVIGEDSFWGTILLWSQALFDRDAAFNKLLTSPVDNGMSRTWNLYYAATAPP
jgi:endo-1,3(4)-beta-glucanase